MDGSSSREMGANSSDENIFFILWFHLIDVYLFGVGICGKNQGIVDKKKAKNIGIGEIDIKEDISGADIKETLDISGIDKSGKSRVDVEENLDISGADTEENICRPDIKKDIGRVDKKKDISKANIEEKPDIGGANREENISGKDAKKKPGKSGIDKLGIGKANKLSTSGANKVKR